MNNQMLLNLLMQNPMIKNNPTVQNALRLYQSGDTQGLNEIASNIAKEKNIDLNQFANDIKTKFGM